jgi:hypothetical protein
MSRNSSKSVSATSKNITTSNKDASNMSNVLTLTRPVTAALEAGTYPVSLVKSDTFVSLVKRARKVLDASDSFVSMGNRPVKYTPVDDTMSGGYSLDSGLNGPVTTPLYGIDTSAWRAAVWKGDFEAVTSRCIYNPEYAAATPHYVKDAFPVAKVVEADLLAPYAGKQVTLSYYIGKDPDTGKELEYGTVMVSGETAREAAIKLANTNKLPVVIRCADTGTKIYTQGSVKGAKATRTTSAGVKAAKGDNADEIARKEEAARVKHDNRMNALQDEAEKMNAAFDASQAKNKAKLIAETAANLAKALAALRTAPEKWTENAAIFDSLKKDIGATCKELNFEHDERNGNPYGTSNRGWKQIAQKLALSYNHQLFQSVRPCNRSTSKNIVLVSAFKLVSEGEEGGAGWHNITPVK